MVADDNTFPAALATALKGEKRVTPGYPRPPGRLATRTNTQKSKFLLSQAFKLKKNMFFVIPEMPSKTLVMVKKNFLITASEMIDAGLKLTAKQKRDIKLAQEEAEEMVDAD